MTLVHALFTRDLRLARNRPGGLIVEGFSACLAPVLMYFLSRSANATHHLFPFVMAGLLVLRLHAFVLRTTENVASELLTGTFELVSCSRWSAAVTATAILAFETASALVITAGMYVMAITVLGAPVPSGTGAAAGIAFGLVFGLLVFGGLTLLILGLVMVVRLSRALSGLLAIALPILAGAYFPVSALPRPFGWIVGALPFHRVTDLFRNSLLHRRLDAAALPVLSAETAVLLAAGLLAYRAGIAYARRHGTLSTG